eukprot:CAMPEP_0115134118 /NCGR_PEP_ID=MMETSP0227-20121206/54887_1 /TAXON_ID=89957 /ORGANISM="Polarella glacialis, Strain CCMP 1383" /LENGTH=51 /DNA_ID=CAMNT_0002540499 /DNA_START=53 /DNA_END=204 /DNA_ORIENTATION=+
MTFLKSDRSSSPVSALSCDASMSKSSGTAVSSSLATRRRERLMTSTSGSSS